MFFVDFFFLLLQKVSYFFNNHRMIAQRHSYDGLQPYFPETKEVMC